MTALENSTEENEMTVPR